MGLDPDETERASMTKQSEFIVTASLALGALNGAGLLFDANFLIENAASVQASGACMRSLALAPLTAFLIGLIVLANVFVEAARLILVEGSGRSVAALYWLVGSFALWGVGVVFCAISIPILLGVT